MPNPYPVALRERAVRAYESGTASIVRVAEVFGISALTLQRWLNRHRREGAVAPLPRGGGWHSPVDLDRLIQFVADRPDATLAELTTAYNRRARVAVHRSSIVRALQRAGFVHKNKGPGHWNWIAPRSKPAASPTAPSSARSPRRGSSSSTNRG
jgi:transposase